MQELEIEGNQEINTEMDDCIFNCLNCFKTCEDVLTKINIIDGNKNANFLIMMKSCAEICLTASRFMLMNSSFHSDVCRVCSRICSECADACDVISDESLEGCIEACRDCVISCNKMF